MGDNPLTVWSWGDALDPWYNFVLGKLSPAQISQMQSGQVQGALTSDQINTQNAAVKSAITQAATNSITGIVDQTLADSEYQQYLGESSTQYKATGSQLDVALGLDSSSSDSSGGFTLTSILILAALGLGGYIVIKELL
jgi:hypothetical protein